MKNIILQKKFILALFVFSIIAILIGKNEVIRLKQSSNYLRRAQYLNSSEKPQEALEVIQKANTEINTTGALIITPQPVISSPTAIPTEIDWEQFNRDLNESLKEVRNINTNNSKEPPQLTSKPLEPTMSTEQKKAPIIISIADNLGNTHQMDCKWSTTHYECYPKENREPIISVKAIPQITFTINAQDPNNRSLFYNFYYSEGCDGKGFIPWLTNNACLTILKTNEFGLRTFIFSVKNDDSYGSVGLDATTALRYRITE